MWNKTIGKESAIDRVLKSLFGFGVIFMSGCASAPPDNVGDACAIFKEKRSWYRAVNKAQQKWGVPKAVQLAIIRQESSFDANAKPARNRFLFVFPGKRKSSARGYAQAIDQTWARYQKDAHRPGADRDNFRHAADFVGWYVDQSYRRLGLAKTDAYQQYIAYHEGWGGFARQSYSGKSGLEAAARRVESTAQTYQRQLSRCEKVKRNGKTRYRG